MPEQPKTQSPVNKAGAAQSPKSANNNKKQASQQPQQAAPAASTPTSPSGNVWSQRQQQAEQQQQQQQQQQPAAQSQPEQQQEGQKQKSQRPRRPRQPKKNQQVRAPQNEGQQDQQQQAQSADNAAPKQPRQRKPRQPRRQPQQSVQQLPPFVFVKGLTPAVDGDKLKTIFEQNGHPVKAARVIVDKRTNTSRGYGFVEFETQDQANAALKMDNTQVEGQAIHVELGGGAPRVSAPRAAPTAANNQNNHNQQRTGGKRRGAPRAPAAGADATTGAQQQQQQRRGRGRGRGRGGRRPATTNAQLPEEKDFPVHSAGPFVDIGANLTKKTWFASDLNDVLQRASNNGVSAIIITGTSVAASKEAIEIAKTRQTGTTKLFATVGVHPHDAKTFDANTTINELEQLITSNPDVVVAIGECGLDFNRNYSEPAAQLTCFEEQIKLAIKLNKPMFLHERDSQPQFMELLNKYKSQLGNGKDRSGPLVCVHCFTGSSALLDELLEFGAFIGVTAVITEATTKRGTELRENIKRVPLDRLMIETDAPFHLPRNVKFAYSRNEPANIKYVANALSTILGVSEQEIAKKTTENAIKFFGLTGI